jgi:hypothetical protein
MVRIKHRYLSVSILYPHGSEAIKVSNVNKNSTAINFHRPTPDDLTARDVRSMIIDGLSENYGDYGVGMISGNLKGEQMPLLASDSMENRPMQPSSISKLRMPLSYILFSSNKYIHC